MNDLFAIEPTAFEDHKDLKYLLSKFGFYEGRFIAEYPNSWIKQVYSHLDKLPDIERSRAMDLLKRFRDGRIISSGLPWIDQKDWLGNVISLKEDQKIADAIVARSHTGKFQSPDLDDSYFEENWDSRQSKVMSDADGYASAASMMLRLSHEVAIVDPYIFKNKYQIGLVKVLKKFADTARTGKCKRFIIFTMVDSETTTGAMVERWVNNCLIDAYNLGIQISLYLLQDIDQAGADDHARYLVSAKGAMFFDKGFIEERVPRLRTVGFLNKQMHDVLRNQYLESEDSLPFKISHRFHLGANPLNGSL